MKSPSGPCTFLGGRVRGLRQSGGRSAKESAAQCPGCCAGSSAGLLLQSRLCDRLRRWLADGKCAAGHPFLLAAACGKPGCCRIVYWIITAEDRSIGISKSHCPRIAFFLQRHRQCGRKLFAGMRLRAVFPHDRSRTGTVSSSNGTYHTRDECFFGDQRRLFGFCRAGRALCAVWMLRLPECAGGFRCGRRFPCCFRERCRCVCCLCIGRFICLYFWRWLDFWCVFSRNGGGIPQHGGTRCHHTAVAMGRRSSRLCIPVRFPLQGQAKLL